MCYIIPGHNRMISQFAPKDRVLVLDFDHTCYDTDAFLLHEIRQPMLRLFEIPVAIWEKSYSQAVKRGYSLREHWGQLDEIMRPASCTLTDIETLGKSICFDKYLYPDVSDVLHEAKKQGYYILLLSFGAPDWQNRKVLGTGLDKLIDAVEYITTDESKGKADAVERYFAGSAEVIFVDNKGSNLDAVLEILSSVTASCGTTTGVSFSGGLASDGEPTSGLFKLQKVRTLKKDMPRKGFVTQTNVRTYLINRVPDFTSDVEGADELRIKYMESREIAAKRARFKHMTCRTLAEIVL